MNVRPKNYAWPEFYDRLVDLSRYSFSWRAIRRRLGATEGAIPRWMNVVRAMSSEGWGRIEYHTHDPPPAGRGPRACAGSWRARPTGCRRSTPGGSSTTSAPLYAAPAGRGHDARSQRLPQEPEPDRRRAHRAARARPPRRPSRRPGARERRHSDPGSSDVYRQPPHRAERSQELALAAPDGAHLPAARRPAGQRDAGGDAGVLVAGEIEREIEVLRDELDTVQRQARQAYTPGPRRPAARVPRSGRAAARRVGQAGAAHRASYRTVPPLALALRCSAG